MLRLKEIERKWTNLKEKEKNWMKMNESGMKMNESGMKMNVLGRNEMERKGKKMNENELSLVPESSRNENESGKGVESSWKFKKYTFEWPGL